GLALRKRGVPVRVREAADYPRAKVCGEFIAGLDHHTLQQLGLADWREAQRLHHDATWHGPNGRILRHQLPRPAIGVSRHVLDALLAVRLREAGGEIQTGERVTLTDRPPPGCVRCHGRRRRGTGGWLGLKVHVRGITLSGDLEMHLGDRAYVGLAGVEDGRVNVCGLFPARSVPPGPPERVLDRHLRAAGLHRLAERLADATWCEDARCAVAGVQFGRMPAETDAVSLGDAFAAIPPFTGHGMAMALQAAVLAAEPLAAWSAGDIEWIVAISMIHRRLRRRFALRLAAARMLHPFLFAPRGQALIARLHAHQLLPL